MNLKIKINKKLIESITREIVAEAKAKQALKNPEKVKEDLKTNKHNSKGGM